MDHLTSIGSLASLIEMTSYHPVFIHLGESTVSDEDVQKFVTEKEKELGRPMNSQELLIAMGEAHEPEPKHRIHLSARPATVMPKLWVPED